MSISRLRVLVGAFSAVTLAACSSERVAGPDGSLTKCGANAVFGSFGEGASPIDVSAGNLSAMTRSAARASALSVAPLSGAVVSYPGPSAQLNDTAARYLVVPQYPVQGSAPDSTPRRHSNATGRRSRSPTSIRRSDTRCRSRPTG